MSNSMNLSPLFSGDMSSDLKAEIINEGQRTQTHRHTDTHVNLAVLHTLVTLSEQETADRRVEYNER